MILKSKVDNYDQILNEINVLKKLDHPNIIKIYEIFENETSIYVVQEYFLIHSVSAKEESSSIGSIAMEDFHKLKPVRSFDRLWMQFTIVITISWLIETSSHKTSCFSRKKS